MRHIHPFPARMAPEIVLSRIANLPDGKKILDPMAGSGMVLGQAAKHGFESIGYDLDPLAHLISKVGATKIKEDKAREAMMLLLKACKKRKKVRLKWIDQNKETSDFIDFWFHNAQKNQLRLLSYYLIVDPIVKNVKVINILKVAISRLIITKEPKASLARDTAHSRPHRTITKNTYNIIEELPKSLEHVLKVLDAKSIQENTKIYLGDARKMARIYDESIDLIITSPPYLNAIDYMRGHRLSLVWFGYSLEKLRKIRRISIGAERAGTGDFEKEFTSALRRLDLEGLKNREQQMLNKYFCDLVMQLSESFRVLKQSSKATYVIGNSTIKGCYIQNSELLKIAGKLAGFKLKKEIIREIPNNRRYLPVFVDAKNSLAKRMRTEHIIELIKAA